MLHVEQEYHQARAAWLLARKNYKRNLENLARQQLFPGDPSRGVGAGLLGTSNMRTTCTNRRLADTCGR